MYLFKKRLGSYQSDGNATSESELAARRGSQVYERLKDLEQVGFLLWERKGRSKFYRTTQEFSEYFGIHTDISTIKHQLERRTLVLR